MKKFKLFQIISCGLALNANAKTNKKKEPNAFLKNNQDKKKDLEKQIQTAYTMYLLIKKTIPKTVEEYSKNKTQSLPTKNIPTVPFDTLPDLDQELIAILKLEQKDAAKNNEASNFLTLKSLYLLMKVMFAPIESTIENTKEHSGNNINLANMHIWIEKEIKNLLKTKSISSHANKIINIYRKKYAKTKNEKDIINLIFIYAFLLVENECKEVILYLEGKGYITKI